LTGQVRRAEEYRERDFRHGDPRFQGANFDAALAPSAIAGPRDDERHAAFIDR
jgi:hypothetical protein